MPASLTENQRAYLKYIQDYIYEKEDYPGLGEIADHFGVKSPSARKTLTALMHKGFLIFDRTSEAGYFIRLIENAGRREKIVGVPIVGQMNRYGEVEFLASLNEIEQLEEDEAMEKFRDTQGIPILTLSPTAESLIALEIVEDVPQVSMQSGDLLIIDPGRQPKPWDICLFAFYERFFLIRVVSKTFDKDTPWLKMAQEYPIPEAFSHPEHEQALNWFPIAMDEENEAYFLNLAEKARWPMAPIPQHLISGTTIRLIRVLHYEKTSQQQTQG
jgi:SOS-response transcriptional repressor LexA